MGKPHRLRARDGCIGSIREASTKRTSADRAEPHECGQEHLSVAVALVTHPSMFHCYAREMRRAWLVASVAFVAAGFACSSQQQPPPPCFDDCVLTAGTDGCVKTLVIDCDDGKPSDLLIQNPCGELYDLHDLSGRPCSITATCADDSTQSVEIAWVAQSNGCVLPTQTQATLCANTNVADSGAD